MPTRKIETADDRPPDGATGGHSASGLGIPVPEELEDVFTGPLKEKVVRSCEPQTKYTQPGEWRAQIL